MPNAAKIFLAVSMLLLLLGSTNLAQAQDPQGALDSLWMVFTQIATDTVLLDLHLFTDNTGTNQITAIGWPLILTVSNNALVMFDTTLATVYAGSPINGWGIKIFGTLGGTNDNPSQSPFQFSVGGIDFGSGIVAGSYTLAHFKMATTGAGSTIIIDTMSLGALKPELVTGGAATYVGGWSGPDTFMTLDVRDHNPPGQEARPTSFGLNQNFPNPFNASTVIRFALPQPSHVRLEVFNVLGQKVNTLVDDDLSAGYKEVMWDGKDQSGSTVASGIYFYRIKAGDSFTNLKKMILIK